MKFVGWILTIFIILSGLTITTFVAVVYFAVNVKNLPSEYETCKNHLEEISQLKTEIERMKCLQSNPSKDCIILGE